LHTHLLRGKVNPRNSEAISNRLIEIALPDGGLLVALEVYVDESLSETNEPQVITCAGYVFRDTQAQRFTRDARKHLERLGLDFFHQTDCANAQDQYEGWELDDCLLAQKLLRENIKRRTMWGFATSINVRDYERIVGGDGLYVPTAYTYALTGCFAALRRWIEESGYQGDVSYFIESGYAHQSDAQRFISEVLLRTEETAHKYRAVGAGFYDKRKVIPLQAADMLAWYAAQEFTRYKRGWKVRRKDFQALLRPDIDMRMDHNPESLRKFRETLIERDMYKISGVEPPPLD
jgi:hypothetical protein